MRRSAGTRARASDGAVASLEMHPQAEERVRARGHARIECWRDGKLAWVEEAHNLLVNLGRDEYLNAALKKSPLAGSWYVGLCTASPTPAAGDTMGSHSGWTEYTNYSESVRQTWTGGTVSSASVDNSASKAVFNINGAGGTAGGCFLTSDSTKSGTSGTLFSVVAFTGGNRAVSSGDILRVTYTFTMADDGV